MSESSALAAAREVVEEETNLTQRHEGTEEEVQSAEGSGDLRNVTEGVSEEMKSVEEVSQDRRDAYPTRERVEAVARIRNSNLPLGMRERLAAVMETSESPYLDVAVCLEAIEETLPEFLRGERRNVARPSHPVGEAFFHGTEELTDAEAETLATKQLERSGLLRGQKVRGRE